MNYAVKRLVSLVVIGPKSTSIIFHIYLNISETKAQTHKKCFFFVFLRDPVEGFFVFLREPVEVLQVKNSSPEYVSNLSYIVN